jgi:hypothetical protein
VEQRIAATRVVMLSGARTLGCAFDPISIFWCYHEAEAPCAVIVEVHNTYGDRQAYLLDPGEDGESILEKTMVVSPFNGVDGRYRIRVSPPTSSVTVSVSLEYPGKEPFVATMRATRRPFSTMNLIRSLFRLSGARTRLLVQWEGLRLWSRGVKVQPR